MIEHWSEGVADLNMAEEILVDLAGTIRRHPWWQARAALTLALLKTLQVVPPARVLDAGCGWGVTLDALEKQGYQATGMDVSRPYPRAARSARSDPGRGRPDQTN